MGKIKDIGNKNADFIFDKLKEQRYFERSICPIYFGSVITNAGIKSLTDGIKLFNTHGSDVIAPVSGSVFKVERLKSGEKIAYVRLFSGKLHVRDNLAFGKITAINIFNDGINKSSQSLNAGDIAKISGLSQVKVGDSFGLNSKILEGYHFAPPTLETVVVAINSKDSSRLRLAMDQLAEQDPLINIRQDDTRQELLISLYGEVQKEVIQDTLWNEYDIAVEFLETTAICIERPSRVGTAVEVKPASRPGAPEFDGNKNQFLATIGLKVEPCMIDSGIDFKIASEARGKMPASFYRAVEETVIESLKQGLYGWNVVDCIVTMTDAGYWPRQSSSHGGFDKNISSTARDFRYLTPLVLMDALKLAGILVCEAINKFRLEIPENSLEKILNILAKLNAIPLETTHLISSRSYEIEGSIPVKNVHAIQKNLSSLTSGEGVFESSFDSYQTVYGPAPYRFRTDNNPINRKEYLLSIMKKG